MGTRTSIGIAGLVVGMTACQPSNPKPSAGSSPSETAPTNTAKAESSPDQAQPQAGTSGQGPAVEELPPPPTNLPPQLHVVAQSESWLGVHNLASGEVAVTAGPLVMFPDPNGRLNLEQSWLRGIENPTEPQREMMGITWWASGLFGTHPDEMILVTTTTSGSRGEDFHDAVSRWTGNGWRPFKTTRKDYWWTVAEAHPWINKSILARRTFTPIYDIPADADETWSPKAAEVKRIKTAIGKQKPLIVIRGEPKSPLLGLRELAAFDSLPSGEIVAFGSRLPSGPPVMVHYVHRADQSEPVEAPLPDRAKKRPVVRGISLRPDGKAHAWGHLEGKSAEDSEAYLIEYDGTKWSRGESPVSAGRTVVDFIAERNGTLWATTAEAEVEGTPIGETLWVRPVGRAWEKVELGEAPLQIAVREPGDVWVVSGDFFSGPWKLHNARKTSKPLEVPNIETLGQWAFDWEPSKPYDGKCTWVFIPIEGAASPTKIAATLEPLRKRKDPELSADLVLTSIRGQTTLGLSVVLLDAGEDRVPLQAELDAIIAETKELLGNKVGATQCRFVNPDQSVADF